MLKFLLDSDLDICLMLAFYRVNSTHQEPSRSHFYRSLSPKLRLKVFVYYDDRKGWKKMFGSRLGQSKGLYHAVFVGCRKMYALSSAYQFAGWLHLPKQLQLVQEDGVSPFEWSEPIIFLPWTSASSSINHFPSQHLQQQTNGKKSPNPQP